tara:strand:- start:842 stop:1192 length:351 start_codon:yes stop_codon:yes gene_type:complete
MDLMLRINNVEKVGSGIGRIKDSMKAYELDVTFTITTFFNVTFQRLPLVKTREITRGKTREKIIHLIKQNSTITSAELAREIGITKKGIEWQLKKLKDEHLITRKGPAKGGRWEVN